MSAADLITRIDTARGDQQRANDLIAEARDRYKPPEPPPPPPSEGIDVGSIAHTVLDFAGFIPGVGVVADLANAALYAAEGDYVNAGLAAAAAVPFVGDAAAAAKLASTAAVGLAGAAAAARNADNAADASRLLGDGGNTAASTPVGRKGFPLQVEPGTNKPGIIGNREYSGHALDQIQGRGLTPSVVENTVRVGQETPGKRPGTTAYYDPTNHVTVIVNSTSGRVITAATGHIKQ
ncbi:hypothetical protein H6F90_10955 [Trichocoleus sp. FACHB-591]|uniref:hypothetical protein n=1 Tax=Trichocoleus sp. FACHB-591 TaxID=2692872 RepID=UPI001687FF01|nr:hypothetical protein [Trichocoleus sp. FACHB-591]MBD2095673.1 hypothetical protein [Trichocoleus sp. FACHB-591]